MGDRVGVLFRPEHVAFENSTSFSKALHHLSTFAAFVIFSCDADLQLYSSPWLRVWKYDEICAVPYLWSTYSLHEGAHGFSLIAATTRTYCFNPFKYIICAYMIVHAMYNMCVLYTT